MIPLTKHASLRCAQRGIRPEFLDDLIQLSDLETPIGSNCRLFRVSPDASRQHPERDRLSRYAVIWSDDSRSVVTVLPVQRSRSGRRYRNISRGGAR